MGLMLSAAEINTIRRLIKCASDAKPGDKDLLHLDKVIGTAEDIEVRLKDMPKIDKVSPLIFVVTIDAELIQKAIDAINGVGIRQSITVARDNKLAVISVECKTKGEVSKCRAGVARVLFERYGAAVDPAVSQALFDTPDGCRPLLEEPENMTPLGTALLNRYNALTYPKRDTIIEIAKAKAKSAADDNDIEVDIYPDMWANDDGTWVSAKIYVSNIAAINEEDEDLPSVPRPAKRKPSRILEEDDDDGE